MKVFASYREFFVPFKKVYRHKGHEYDGKPIIVLSVTLENGAIYLGEIGPFFGVNVESTSDLLDGNELVSGYLDLPNPDQMRFDEVLFGADLDVFSPSVCNAWEQVMLQIYWSSKINYLESKTELTGLLSLDSSTWMDDFISLKKKEIKVFKVKVGRMNHAEELSRLRELVKSLSSNNKIRLDANRSLCPENALSLFDEVGSFLDYFEEPFRETEDHFRNYPFRIAIDEILWSEGDYPISKNNVLVIKPVRLCISSIFRWLNRGWDPCNIILSSCFESGIAVRVYALLCEYLGLRQSQGFGPYLNLQSDFLDEPLKVCNSTMQVLWQSGGFSGYD